MDGNKIVVIHDIRFKGKRSIDWDDVEAYLKQYIEEFFEVIETGDVIFIGKDLPDEFAGSKDTSRLRGTLAKARVKSYVRLVLCQNNVMVLTVLGNDSLNPPFSGTIPIFNFTTDTSTNSYSAYYSSLWIILSHILR